MRDTEQEQGEEMRDIEEELVEIMGRSARRACWGRLVGVILVAVVSITAWEAAKAVVGGVTQRSVSTLEHPPDRVSPPGGLYTHAE